MTGRQTPDRKSWVRRPNHSTTEPLMCACISSLSWNVLCMLVCCMWLDRWRCCWRSERGIIWCTWHCHEGDHWKSYDAFLGWCRQHQDDEGMIVLQSVVMSEWSGLKHQSVSVQLIDWSSPISATTSYMLSSMSQSAIIIIIMCTFLSYCKVVTLEASPVTV